MFCRYFRRMLNICECLSDRVCPSARFVPPDLARKPRARRIVILVRLALAPMRTEWCALYRLCLFWAVCSRGHSKGCVRVYSSCACFSVSVWPVNCVRVFFLCMFGFLCVHFCVCLCVVCKSEYICVFYFACMCVSGSMQERMSASVCLHAFAYMHVSFSGALQPPCICVPFLLSVCALCFLVVPMCTCVFGNLTLLEVPAADRM